MKRLLIANRGEIAVRIARAARERGIEAVALFAPDDAGALHTRRADTALPLPGRGPQAYLAVEAVVAAGRSARADAVHPGYGFLAERADFARAVLAAGMRFVGPAPETLETFGEKTAARALARTLGIPVPEGTGPTDAAGAASFLAGLPAGSAILLKAVGGGGGRGLRVVRDCAALPEAFARAEAEARAAFGDSRIFAEACWPAARHIEVQLAGDGLEVVHFHTRDCSIQRRHQKLVELAPAPGLDPGLVDELTRAAVALGRAVKLRSLATVEFLVAPDGRFAFIEANPRLQVEHPVTEEVLGVDLVGLQLALAAGTALSDLGLAQSSIPAPRGYALEARLCAETIGRDGAVHASMGTLTRWEPPSGPGIRVDAGVEAGSRLSPVFDSLFAKIIACHPSPAPSLAFARMSRALGETVAEGVATNLGYLRRLFATPDVLEGPWETGLLDRLASTIGDSSGGPPAEADAILAPIAGILGSVMVRPGDLVPEGATVAVLEAMKMEHEVRADRPGRVEAVLAEPGAQVAEGMPLLRLLPAEVDAAPEETTEVRGPRADLEALRARKAAGLDAARPAAVARRHASGKRTARENIADLVDPGSFMEIGATVVAAQRRRRSLEDLIANTSADGIVCGTASVNGTLFPPERARVAVLAYDYMTLAGTQGHFTHLKKDRMFELAARAGLPVLLFAEGGGGRPGDTDAPGVAGLDCLAFRLFAQLSGKVPTIAIVAGYCFAGNAILAGSSDLLIACEGANIGVGGPAMIEYAGLGVFPPEAVGPMPVQVPNGVVDVLAKDEAEAVAIAKQALAFFQGSLPPGDAPDPEHLRHIVPENRRRAYAMRTVIEGIADRGSILELRPSFGVGMITALGRIAGRPIAILANNPAHLGGAIDTPGADKAARLLALADSWGLPILSLIDCPGIMVGPEIEKTALVRRAARVLVAGANLSVPLVAIVVRKGYGLGAQAMAGASFRGPDAMLAWPTAEFGGMGLEGAVRLGFRKELEAIADPAERQARYEALVAEAYARGSALNMAAHFEVDEVIDPAETRDRILAALDAAGPRRPPQRWLDTW